MGMGATDTMGRTMASLGKIISVPVQFQRAVDVANAGVLLAIPALLVNGLLKRTNEYFELPAGYYDIKNIFLLLAVMALCRIKHPDNLRYVEPGELGKVLGLDRIPEVRTLRTKLAVLRDGKIAEWSSKLCEDWMVDNPETAGVLYVDGHVRVYHGDQTQLPRHYVTREKLCLRATTDYWVNAMDGQPFFLVNQPIDPGMIEVIKEKIVPRLLRDVPGQPTEERLEQEPLLHRLSLVFDREGYSPDFFSWCKERRIACITYHKHPESDWPSEEFVETAVTMSEGQVLDMKLAERGTQLSNGLWVRQVRKISSCGRQTAVLSTDYQSNLSQIAARMFSRWTQENFFRYMRMQYGLDCLADYSTTRLTDTTKVVNPAWRIADSQIRTKQRILRADQARYGALELQDDIEPAKVEQFQSKKAELKLQIEQRTDELTVLKADRKKVPRHINYGQLPEGERFRVLDNTTKDFLDTIKMIAYRAETSMASVLREQMSRLDDARCLLRQIYCSNADIFPDPQAATLTVRLHHMTNRSSDLAVRHLCDELNETRTIFPGTELRLVYELGSDQNHRDQVV